MIAEELGCPAYQSRSPVEGYASISRTDHIPEISDRTRNTHVVAVGNLKQRLHATEKAITNEIREQTMNMKSWLNSTCAFEISNLISDRTIREHGGRPGPEQFIQKKLRQVSDVMTLNQK